MDPRDAPAAGQELNWLLDDLAARVDQIKRAVILPAMAWSSPPRAP